MNILLTINVLRVIQIVLNARLLETIIAKNALVQDIFLIKGVI
jgi:hypothetical protein